MAVSDDSTPDQALSVSGPILSLGPTLLKKSLTNFMEILDMSTSKDTGQSIAACPHCWNAADLLGCCQDGVNLFSVQLDKMEDGGWSWVRNSLWKLKQEWSRQSSHPNPTMLGFENVESLLKVLTEVVIQLDYDVDDIVVSLKADKASRATIPTQEVPQDNLVQVVVGEIFYPF